MEEYQAKQHHLRHLRKIAEINNGKAIVEEQRKSQCKLKRPSQGKFLKLRSDRANCNLSRVQLKTHQSSVTIMRQFMVGKENKRLGRRLLHMNSVIRFNNSKTCESNQPKKAKEFNTVCFKIFEIKFDKNQNLPQEQYKIFLLNGKKKTLLAKDTLYQLRKKQIKIKRKSDVILKIEHKNGEGITIFNETGLLDIVKNGTRIGNAVLSIQI